LPTVTEAIAAFLIVAGVVALFINGIYHTNIPAETILSLGVGLLGGQYAGRYLEARKSRGD